VSQIQSAKDAGYVVPPELAKIGDGIADILSRSPCNTLGSILGWSYIVTLAEGGFSDPEIEELSRFMVLLAIDSEDNDRCLK
jgi:hypothetical protein